MTWQADHAFLIERGWRRGADKLWRCTPRIGGSYLTRNALAVERGERKAGVTELMERILRWMAENPGAHTPNHIGYSVGVDSRPGGQYRSRGPGSIIAPALTALEVKGFIRFGPRPDGMSGTAYRITEAGRAAIEP